MGRCGKKGGRAVELQGRGFLALVALLALAASVRSQQEPAAPFLGPLQPLQLAALTQGATSSPGMSSWSALAPLLAGTHRDVEAWSLRGAMSSRVGRNQVGAATLFLMGFQADPLGWTEGVFATLLAGHETGASCWTLLDTDQLQPFPETLKDGRIHDRQSLKGATQPISKGERQEAELTGRMKDGRLRGPIRDGKGIFLGDEEALAFAQVLVLANYSSAAAFREAARDDLSYANLYQEPEKYRGEVVRLTGRLRRLTAFSPPLDAAAQGVNQYYEAWIFNDVNGNNPYCAIFVELPPGLKPAEKVQGVEVAFDGYFYKRFRYKSADSYRAEQFRDAPVLIGHTLTVLRQPAEGETAMADGWGHDIIFVFVGLVATALVVVFGLMLWYRQGDRPIRQRLEAARASEVVLPEPREEGEELEG